MMTDDNETLAEVIGIFEPVLRRIRSELKKGPLPMSYISARYGTAVFLQLLDMVKDLEVSIEEGEQVVGLKGGEGEEDESDRA
jgi:hypothetical protein